MGAYSRTGKQIIYNENGSLTHIADAGDEEKADVIVKSLNGRSTNFIPLAIRTCSPMFHGDMVSDHAFRAIINDCIDNLNKLDKVKKSLFYGRDNNLMADGEHDVSDLPALIDSDRATSVDIIHAILGIATEAGELLEALRNAYNKNGFDWVNIKEETGDIDWYKALLANRGNYTFEEVQELIIKKLVSRYPDKYASELALNRNLEAERAVLEDNVNAVIDSEIGLKPTQPVSGPAAVNKVELESKAAFAAVKNVQADTVDAPVTRGGRADLSKSIGARETLMPDEDIARQSIRREDEEK